MGKTNNNEIAFEGFERSNKWFADDFLAKEREKRNIYFKGFVADKTSKEGYSDAQRRDMADWLKEAYELGKKDGRAETIEGHVKNKMNGFDPAKIFDNFVEYIREVMAPTYFDQLMECEKIVSDTRAVQVSLLMDKIQEQRKSSPFSWLINVAGGGTDSKPSTFEKTATTTPQKVSFSIDNTNIDFSREAKSN